MNEEKTHRIDLNQTSLQDFIDCPRRFELNSFTETLWPAAHSSPQAKYEKLTEIGNQFHHLCQQFFAGVDPALIASAIPSEDLQSLWRSFQPYGNSLLPLSPYYEQILRVPFGEHFLIAKFDLLVLKPDDGYLIIDWKTAGIKPSRTDLATKVQTYLYPFIFHQAGGELFGVDEISPSEITMQYYYPLANEPEEIFPYSETKHKEVSLHLTDLISQINNLVSLGESFPLTDDLDLCKYCRFRSYCERGYLANPLPAGAEIESEDLSNTFFDWDLIKEIEY